MKLIVLRHGKAEDSHKDGDYARQLTKKGHAQAARQARRLAGLELLPGIILSSPLVRSRETAETFPAKHAPQLGEDSAAVLGELGVDGETIARLLARDTQNAAAVHAMLEARAAAEAASTDD